LIEKLKLPRTQQRIESTHATFESVSMADQSQERIHWITTT